MRGCTGKRSGWITAVLLLGALCAARPQQSNLPNSPTQSDTRPASLADAQRARAAGKFDQAESILRRYLQENASSGDAAYLLAYSLLREGKAAEALAAYTQAAALRKPSASELRGVAQAYVLLEDYTDADKWLTLSLRMDPRSADTWYNLGRSQYTQNRFADAAACYQKALLLSPRSVKAENNLGLAYEGLNRAQEAELAYRQAIAWQDADQADVASEQPLLNLAILLLHGNGTAEAQTLLSKAVALAPKDAHIHEQLGQIDMRKENFEAAAREFELATRLAPLRSSLHFMLGQAYKHLGRQTEAAAEFAETARLARILPENGSR